MYLPIFNPVWSHDPAALAPCVCEAAAAGKRMKRQQLGHWSLQMMSLWNSQLLKSPPLHKGVRAAGSHDWTRPNVRTQFFYTYLRTIIVRFITTLSCIWPIIGQIQVFSGAW